MWAEKRLELAESNTEIQGYVNGVFWDRNTLAEQNATHSKSEKAKSKRNGKRQSKELISRTEQGTVQRTLFDFGEV